MFGNASRFTNVKRKVPSNVSLDRPGARRTEPNRQAQFTNALEKQHTILRNSISALEHELDQLNMSLSQKNETMDHDRWAIHMELEKIKNENSDLPSSDITSTNNAGRVVQCDTSINQLLRINQQLSNDLQVNIINLQAGKQSEADDGEKHSLHVLRQKVEKSYRAMKMSEIDLEAQLAAVQSLEKEMSKLNGLPQILPILKSSIKECEQAVKQSRQTVIQLDNNQLTQSIAYATNESLKPLLEAQGTNKAVASSNSNDEYDKIIKLLVEQAATNQLFLYIMELEEDLLRNRTDHQSALLLDIREFSQQVDTGILKDQIQNVTVDTDKAEHEFLSSFQQLLKIRRNSDDILADVVEPRTEDMVARKQLERLTKELQGTQDRIEFSVQSMNDMMVESHQALQTVEHSSKLYQNDRQSNAHIPEEALELHGTYESFINDLQSEIQRYQKETVVNAELTEKKRRFALFWTDQNRFEQEFGSI